MKLSILALDYDGTIARHDSLEPSVRAAIAAARRCGIVVLLVSGRTLDDLRRVAGGLHFVDGVVAENGAVLHFPDSGHTSLLAPPLPAPFLAELDRRGVPHTAGQCLVDAHADDAPRILHAIRDMELPLVLLFNASRVMTLPQGISKATGLHTALDTLRLSARNTVAIGDAENDHELLRLAEVGVAVEWGSAALRAAADVVLEGRGPEAVAAYIRTLARSGAIPTPPRARRLLRLGFTDDGREFALAVRGRNVLVAGDAKSGKSWVAGLLCEQLILHGYCVCAIDPEGDYRSLEGLPGVSVLGGDDPPPTPHDLTRALRYPDRSVVIDLSRRPHEEKAGYIRSVLPAINELRRRTGLPHRILVDEAHYFLHDADALRLLDLEANGYIFVTYWASRLPREVLAGTEVMIVTRESNPAEIRALQEWCTCGPVDPKHWAILAHLATRQAVALPVTEEAGGHFQTFTLGARLTRHVRHREKYVDVPVREGKAFYFRPYDHHPARWVSTLRGFVEEIESAPQGSLDEYLRRGDFSRWVAGVFGDFTLAATVRAFEERYAGSGDSAGAADIAAAIRARYDLEE